MLSKSRALFKVTVPSLETEKFSLPVPDKEKVIASPSVFVAEAVAMVVPVAVSSAKELAAKEVERSINSTTSVTEKVSSEEAEEVPSDAVKVSV